MSLQSAESEGRGSINSLLFSFGSIKIKSRLKFDSVGYSTTPCHKEMNAPAEIKM